MVRKCIATLLIFTLFVTLFGCSGAGSGIGSGNSTSTEPPPQTTDDSGLTDTQPTADTRPTPTPQPYFTATLMAQDAELYGSLLVLDDGAVGQFEQRDSEDKLEFTVDIEYEGFYKLEFEMRTIGGFKSNYLHINDAPSGEFTADSADFSTVEVSRVYFEQGQNTVAVSAHWGWCAIRSLTITTEGALDVSLYNASANLVNPNADENALRLMSFLADTYGNYFLSGQQSQGDRNRNNGLFLAEAKFVYDTTGKRPAVIGLDMMDYSLSRVANGESSFETEAAIEAWEAGAIVTFCWHWNAPTPYIDGTWYSAFYTQHSQNGFFKKIMDGNDPQGYELLLEDIDAIAVQLTRLRDAGVPILWRPLHEASGGWFWWGTDKDSYLKLYKLLFERLTDYHNLTNLIWVWNGQHKDWYPGDEYVDIIGEDVYADAFDYSSQSAKFFEAAEYTDTNKMIVLSENGVLFDPDLAARDGAWWGYWCVWNGNFARSEEYTDFGKLIEVYNHELVLTLDELPDLKTYPIR